MANNDAEYLSLASEIRELEELIALVPENWLIERLSLEARLERIKSLLAESYPDGWPPE